MHERICSDSTHREARCTCRPLLEYDLYGWYDVDTFLAHLKLRHLEYYERFGYILERMSVPRRSVYELKDVWGVQKLIRGIYGVGDDLT
jgi:hypothetical protein